MNKVVNASKLKQPTSSKTLKANQKTSPDSVPTELFKVHKVNLVNKDDINKNNKRQLNSTSPTNKRILRPSVMKKSISNTTGAKKLATATVSSTSSHHKTLTKIITTANKKENEKGKTKKNVNEGPPKKKPKRAAWDTKGRLEDLEENFNETQGQLDYSKEVIEELKEKNISSEKKIEELQNFRFSLQSTVQVKEQENCEINGKVAELKRKIESLEEQKELESKTLKKELAELNELYSNSVEREKLLKQENFNLKSTISTMSCSSLALEEKLKSLNITSDNQKETIKVQEGEINERDCTIKENIEKIKDLEGRIREEESIRRGLHNTIQELKGNIRVFCRVRPNFESEKDPSHFNFVDDKSIELTQLSDNMTGKQVSKNFTFSFDKVFTPKDDQEIVFQEISQLIQSALDGYNVCIFAYGQTGSGKTFTMEGPSDSLNDMRNRGMIPRAVNQIFLSSEKLKTKGWEFAFECNFLEIYNETIRDLLNNESTENLKLEIRHINGKTIVSDATSVEVKDPAEVQEVLLKASKSRAVAATNCNERSSRSHSVFMLKLNGKNDLTSEKVDGVLNLIDLAGSERLNSSLSKGDRLKETQNINKSLSCLGDVIFSLSNKDAHIPYRNSKLTYLLQNSLGGNSKTLMFVNVNPNIDSINESLCSLRFATKVNSCQIGTARAKKS